MVTAKTATMRLIGMNADELTPFRTGLEETIRWYHDHWLPSVMPVAA